LGIITTRHELAQNVHVWSEKQKLRVHTEVFLVRDTQRTSEVVEVVCRKSVIWTGILTPYEYVTGDAAMFANEYQSRLNARLLYHPIQAARLSRNKPDFKEFLLQTFCEDQLILPTLYEHVQLTPDITWEGLLKLIKESKPGRAKQCIVIKPIDAAGSTGVRPV